ncbi:GGDEF domain-containing protein [uncultured Desulfuromonas sp.]|uniref:GGDEF domain-containing protein n=1 Tax=uncultured Desulfuromonas sp. TaxID=181013 RepID=UPI002AAAFF5C|nr:GGDEF domain-containing protein [uncultured Desulfuromonas sp.]
MAELANFLVIGGALVLLLALFPVDQLRRRLPHSPCRIAWMFLSVLVCLFFLGYALYALLFWNEAQQWHDLVVPVIFFFGAIFVLIVCLLAARTADDVTRLCHLEYENILDPLLGIYNRRHMDRCLRSEADKTRRYALDLSVLLIDVDFFKKVNDTYGHLVGDRVLQALAQMVKGSVRDFDMVFRYGGEEIMVLLPYTNSNGAQTLGNRLCQWVGERCLIEEVHQGEPVNIQVTISVGVSTFDPAVEDEGEMVARADMALYRAKKNGRNRVEVADQAQAGTFKNE